MHFDLTDALLGLAGGLLIGGAAAIFLLFLGRICGISGIAAGLLRPSADLEFRQNTAFVVGLVGAPLLLALVAGAPEIGITDSPLPLLVGGLLVGFGTRLGGGCTSGHGVCGMTRFSPRSIAATAVFMGVGVLTATLIRPLLGA
jgi:uncharacterized membrane protein YedE/YeeE